MYKFSKRSKKHLVTLKSDIQGLLTGVLKTFDISILSGYRSPEEQFELYKLGRVEINGVWQVVYRRIAVTYCDGYKRLSRHNYKEDPAFDIVPYPVDWSNLYAFHQMGEIVLAEAKRRKIKLEWGAYWKKIKDFPHFQRRRV